MKLIKVAAAALNQTPLDWNGNRENIVAAIQAAHDPLPLPPQLGRVIGLKSGSAA